MSKLDDMLNDLEFRLGIDDRHNDVKKDDAKQQIKDLMFELIGEDEHVEYETIRTQTGETFTGTDDIVTPALNVLRKELRQKVNEL